MIIICAGMFRSGSTWQYQIAREVLSRGGAYEACGYLHPPQVAELLARFDSLTVPHVLKTHDIVPEVGVRDPRVTVLYSYRDLRDVAVSMAHKIVGNLGQVLDHWLQPERVIETDAFWMGRPPAVVQPYEAWFGHTLPWILRIAKALGNPMSVVDAEELCVKYALKNQQSRAAAVEADHAGRGVDFRNAENALTCDKDSLLHWNHCRDGRIGGWKETADEAQRRDLEARFGGWLRERGYLLTARRAA